MFYVFFGVINFSYSFDFGGFKFRKVVVLNEFFLGFDLVCLIFIFFYSRWRIGFR